MDKSTISMAILNSYVKLPEGMFSNQQKLGISPRKNADFSDRTCSKKRAIETG